MFVNFSKEAPLASQTVYVDVYVDTRKEK